MTFISSAGYASYTAAVKTTLQFFKKKMYSGECNNKVHKLCGLKETYRKVYIYPQKY